MRKNAFFLAFMLSCCMTFAQTEQFFTSLKPFNKGNFKIDVIYSSLMEKNLGHTYPDFRVGVGYCITDWSIAGIFGSYGKQFYLLGIGGGTLYIDGITYPVPILYNGEVTEHYFHYGLNVELHPLSIWLPSFHWIDPYCRGELGMRTIAKQYVPDIDDNYAERVRHNFLYGCSFGLAINPSRHFGVFYELAFDNLNKELDLYSGEKQTKPFHRFGINVRFPGPKKWQKQ